MAEFRKEIINSLQAIMEYRKILSTKYYVMGLLVLLIILVLGWSLKDFFVIVGLGVAASYSTIYKRYIRVPSSVELVTLGTYVTALAYGPLIGALFAAITTLISEIISAAFDINTIIYMIARALAAVVAFLLFSTGANISAVWMAMIMLLVFNLIATPIYLLQGDAEIKIKSAYYIVTNTVWNFIIFILIAAPLLQIAM